MSKQDAKISRRTLAKSAGAALLAQSAARAQRANERLRIGFIGVGVRGFGAHVKRIVQAKEMGSNVDPVAVADVYDVHRERSQDYVESQTGVRPKGYLDYRDLLARDDIDAVFVGTPDHCTPRWRSTQ